MSFGTSVGDFHRSGSANSTAGSLSSCSATANAALADIGLKSCMTYAPPAIERNAATGVRAASATSCTLAMGGARSASAAAVTAGSLYLIMNVRTGRVFASMPAFAAAMLLVNGARSAMLAYSTPGSRRSLFMAARASSTDIGGSIAMRNAPSRVRPRLLMLALRKWPSVARSRSDSPVADAGSASSRYLTTIVSTNPCAAASAIGAASENPTNDTAARQALFMRLQVIVCIYLS